MKKSIGKIGAFLMALLVLFSSTAFLKSTHYCAGEIADVSYFVSSDTCTSTAEESCANDFKSHTVEKKSCCSTDSEIVQGQDFSDTTSSVSLMKQNFDVLFFLNDNSYSITNTLFSDKAFCQSYRPPLVFQDLNILYDTFLI